MHPILATFGPFTLFARAWGPYNLNSYGLMMALAFAVTVPLLARDVSRILGPRVGMSPAEGYQRTWDLFAWIIPSALVGGRVFYALENHQEFAGRWYEVLYLWQGGLVFYGGLLGAIVAAIVWMRSRKWPIVLFFDLAAPFILLGHALGRVGCFLEGCCYGVVDQAHGLVFPGIGDGLPHLPTQLWELYGDLFLFALIWWVRGRLLPRPGAAFALYAFTYGLLRYILEFYRRDGSLHYLGVFLSPSQAMSAFLTVAAAIYLVWAFTGRRSADAQA